MPRSLAQSVMEAQINRKYEMKGAEHRRVTLTAIHRANRYRPQNKSAGPSRGEKEATCFFN